ncbi:hypothetical protein, partial [Collimonas sp.]|uniref:hypothetical protein n=1 Tax=Collimonas sp. TaxID=1963772 RepID=UPI0037C02E32
SLSNIRKNRRHKSHLLEDEKSREAHSLCGDGFQPPEQFPARTVFLADCGQIAARLDRLCRRTWCQETNHRIAYRRRTITSQSWLSGETLWAANGDWRASDFCLLD